MKPKVLILIATNNLSGPGKGLMQFLKEAENKDLDYVLSNFLQKNQSTFEFLEVAKERGLNIKLLKQKFWIDPSLIWQAYNLCRLEGCNIIQTHGYKGHIIGLLLSSFMKVKWIAVAHGWTCENKKVLFYNKLERFLFRFADVAIVVSQPLHDTINAVRGKNKPTKKILNAVDPGDLKAGVGRDATRKKYQLSNSDIVFSVFGRLSPEKGQLVLIEAFKSVKESVPNSKLMVVGEGPDELLLLDEINELNLLDDIIFCGYQRTVRDYYEASDIVVLPSYSEGLPNVVLEAMCLGKPVIATDVGSVHEIIEDGVNGWIVPSGMPGPMAGKMIEAAKNMSESKKIGRASQKMLYPKFSPKHRAEQILDVYQKVIN